MGDMYQYHVTMLITADQESAIRLMYSDKNWPCWMNVLTDETVADITLSGYAGVFQLPVADQPDNMITHIKSEVIHDDTGESYTEDHTDEREPSDPGEPSHLVNPGRVIMDGGNMILEQNVTNFARNMSNDGGKMILGQSVTNFPRDITCSNEYIDGGKMILEQSVTNFARGMSNQGEPEAEIRRKGIKCEQLIPPIEMITDLVGNEKSKLKFKCSLCDIELQTKSTLELHCKVCHEKEWIEFQRADCSSTSNRITKLQISEAVNGSFMEDCKTNIRNRLDPIYLSNTTAAKSAVNIDQLVPTIRCTPCHKNFKNLEELIFHKKLKHSNKCDMCDGVYHSKQNLKEHKLRIHNSVVGSPMKIFKCTQCEKDYLRKVHLEAHINSKHSGIRPYSCEVCSKEFASKYGMKEHERTCKGMNPLVPCPTCNRTFQHRASLKHHHDAVHSGKTYKCSTCGKQFVYKPNLTRHERVCTKL